MSKRAKVHGVHLEYVQDPWLRSLLWCRIQRQLGAQPALFFCGKFPDYELVVTPVAAKGGRMSLSLWSLSCSLAEPTDIVFDLRDQPVFSPSGDA